jgi:hypothetical protein
MMVYDPIAKKGVTDYLNDAQLWTLPYGNNGVNIRVK